MDAFLTRKRPRSDESSGPSGRTSDSSISPPPKRNVQFWTSSTRSETIDLTQDDDEKERDVSVRTDKKRNDIKPTDIKSIKQNLKDISSKTIQSPIQLNHVKDLPVSCNLDTTKLSGILGDPIIKECWLFNYLFDIDFIMYGRRSQKAKPD